MKTSYIANLKDNVATGAVLAAIAITILGGFASETRGNHHEVTVQTMDAIVITAPAVDQRMDTIVVSAKR